MMINTPIKAITIGAQIVVKSVKYTVIHTTPHTITLKRKSGRKHYKAAYTKTENQYYLLGLPR